MEELNSLNKTKWWDYFLVYLLLLLSAGFFFRNLYNGITVPTYLLILLLIAIKRRIKLHIDVLKPALTMVCLIIITALFTGIGDDGKRYMYCILSLLTAYLITQIIKYKDFCVVFSNVIYLISLASIVGWGLAKFAPFVILGFPKMVNSAGVQAHFLGLAFVMPPYVYGIVNRVQGVFWEPGAFQTMIVIAILCDWFVNKRIEKIRYAVYFAALILTFSTTGYICIVMLVAIFCVKKDKKLRGIGLILFFLSFFCFIVLYEFKDYLPSFIYYSIFTKLETLFKYSPGVHISNSAAEITAYTRMNSVYYPFVSFLKSPLWGIGFSGFNRLAETLNNSGMFTCSPVNFFAYFGVFYGIITAKGLVSLVKKYSETKMCKLLIILLILITSASEDYCGGVACISAFILYGYQKDGEMSGWGILENEGCIY